MARPGLRRSPSVSSWRRWPCARPALWAASDARRGSGLHRGATMRTVWIVVGLLIAIGAWMPLNFSHRGDIPFFAAILAFVGTIIGGIIVLVAVVTWLHHRPGDRQMRTLPGPEPSGSPPPYSASRSWC